MRHGVTPRWSRRKREIHNAKGDVQPLAGFARYQLAYARDLECGALDGLRHHVKRLSFAGFQRLLDHAGAGNTHVDRRLRFAHAAERAGHEGIVLHGVGKDDELCAAQTIGIGGQFRRPFDNGAHIAHGVHVQTGLGAADIHRGAKPLGGGKHLGDGFQQTLVGVRRALLHQRGVSAEEIHAHFTRGAIQPVRDGAGIALADQADGRDGDALVHNRDTELAFKRFARAHKILCYRADLVIHTLSAALGVGIGAVQQVDAKGDGADVEVLLLNHPHRLQDFTSINHAAPP